MSSKKKLRNVSYTHTHTHTHTHTRIHCLKKFTHVHLCFTGHCFLSFRHASHVDSCFPNFISNNPVQHFFPKVKKKKVNAVSVDKNGLWHELHFLGGSVAPDVAQGLIQCQSGDTSGHDAITSRSTVGRAPSRTSVSHIAFWTTLRGASFRCGVLFAAI